MSDNLTLLIPLVVVVGLALVARAVIAKRMPRERRQTASWRLSNLYFAVGAVALVAFLVFFLP